MIKCPGTFEKPRKVKNVKDHDINTVIKQKIAITKLKFSFHFYKNNDSRAIFSSKLNFRHYSYLILIILSMIANNTNMHILNEIFTTLKVIEGHKRSTLCLEILDNLSGLRCKLTISNAYS